MTAPPLHNSSEQPAFEQTAFGHDDPDSDTASRTVAPPNAALAARYGHSAASKRRSKLVYLIGGVFASLVVIAWVVWAGLDQAGASIDAQDTGHVITDSRTVTIGWQVSVAPGTPVSCALQVQNTDHAIVGWKIVKLPPGKVFTTLHESQVRATEQPVTGLIYSCWLT